MASSILDHQQHQLTQTIWKNPTSLHPRFLHDAVHSMAWEQHLIDHFIYPPYYDQTQYPANLGNIKVKLSRRWPSLDQSRFSDDDYSEFLKTRKEAMSKSSALALVFSTFIGKLDIPHGQGIPFRNLRRLTEENFPLPRPDFYDGTQLSTHECEVPQGLAKFLMPSTNLFAPIIPPFLMIEGAATTTSPILQRKAWYNSIFAASAMHQVRSHILLQPLNGKKAYVITASYEPREALLTLYVTHTVLSNNPAPPFEYHTVVCSSWNLENEAETFRTAISALKNTREWAWDQRDDMVRLLNGMVMVSRVTKA